MNLATLTPRIKLYAQLMRLHQPIGIGLLLWPTLWALVLVQDGHLWNRTTGIFILGVLLSRSAGCVINDINDRQFDSRVQRTKNRPLACGKISVSSAYMLVLVLLLLDGILLLFLPIRVWWWAGVALIFLLTYPLTKRFFALPQLYLGLAFSMSIPMVFLTYQNQLPIVAFWLWLANVAWVFAYDTVYALQDKADDSLIGIHSSALTLKSHVKPVILLCYALAWLGLLIVGLVAHLGLIYGLACLLSAYGVIKRYGMLDITNIQACHQAFMWSNRFGLYLFVGMISDKFFCTWLDKLCI